MGLWVENYFYFEPVQCILIFILRLFQSQFIKIKTGKNKYILGGNSIIVQIVLHMQTLNTLINQTISDIFSKIKFDPNFKNVNEVILAGDMSFKTDYIPNILKTDKIAPVFKTGESDRFSNYRSISLTSSFSKLLENI